MHEFDIFITRQEVGIRSRCVIFKYQFMPNIRSAEPYHISNIDVTLACAKGATAYRRVSSNLLRIRLWMFTYQVPKASAATIGLSRLRSFRSPMSNRLF